ncbi:MAG: hypothetical protein ACYYK0_07050 [Candidatus Eutrophobiaceae bacterium]
MRLLAPPHLPLIIGAVAGSQCGLGFAAHCTTCALGVVGIIGKAHAID